MNGHGNNNRGVGYSTSVDNTQTAMANMTLQQNYSAGQHSQAQSIPTNRMPPPPPMPGRAIPLQQQYQQH